MGMHDATDDPAGPASPWAQAPMAVSALVRSLQDLLEHRFPLLWVKGEISNYLLARSGHAYFVLKDARAQMRCVMFRQRHQNLEWQPRDGDQVELRATLGLYEARGDLQLAVDSMRRAGAGALFERFQQLRDRLSAEGLFDPSLKRPLPARPRCIGVVTSPQAAALHDVLTTLARRNPLIPVLVQPAPVQGRDAAPRIAAALAALGAGGSCDLIILARGGGSIEDLWSFNEEVVARAIRACPVPVVTGIGHETDFTIADFAADCRAPTPTAAAEMAAPDSHALRERIAVLARRLGQHVEHRLARHSQDLDGLGGRLRHPGERLRTQHAVLCGLQERLTRGMQRELQAHLATLASLQHRHAAIRPQPAAGLQQVQALLQRLRLAQAGRQQLRDSRVAQLCAALEHLNPLRVLERGYSVVRDAQGRILTDATVLKASDPLDIRFARGRARVRVEGTET